MYIPGDCGITIAAADKQLWYIYTLSEKIDNVWNVARMWGILPALTWVEFITSVK